MRGNVFLVLKSEIAGVSALFLKIVLGLAIDSVLMRRTGVDFLSGENWASSEGISYEGLLRTVYIRCRRV